MPNQSELNKLHLLDTIDQNIDGYVFYQLLFKADRSSKFLFISDQIKKYNTHSLEEIIENPKLLYDRIHPDYIEYVLNTQRESFINLTNFHAEFPLYINDHDYRWLSVISVPLKKENGDVIWSGIQIDITEKKVQELKIKKQNRILSLLNTVNDKILKFKDANELLDRVIRCIIEKGSYKLVWICLKPDENSNNQKVEVFKSFGVTDYLKEIYIDLNDPNMSEGPTARALKYRTISVTNNMTTSEDFKPWLEKASRYGLRSSVVFPMNINGRIASINIYSDEQDSFNKDELELLTRIVNNINDALVAIYNEEEKQKANLSLERKIVELEKFAFIVSHVLRAPVANILGLNSLINEDKEHLDKYIGLLNESTQKLDAVIRELNETLQKTKSDK